MVWEVASEYAQQSEFWQAACQGDLMSDAYNACRQPDDGNGTTVGLLQGGEESWQAHCLLLLGVPCRARPPLPCLLAGRPARCQLPPSSTPTPSASPAVVQPLLELAASTLPLPLLSPHRRAPITRFK